MAPIQLTPFSADRLFNRVVEAFGELVERVRLDEVGARHRLAGMFDIASKPRRGQQHHGRLPRLAEFTQRLNESEAVYLRHVDVQEDEIGPALAAGQRA